MQNRVAEYQRLNADKNYADVQYDAATGGLKATHVLHQFDRKRGIYEVTARDVLFLNGHKVILCSEIAPEGIRTPDGYLNEKIFDIKGVEGTGHNTIKRKLNEALRQGCEHLILYYPVTSNYDVKTVQRGYNQYLGVLRKEGRQGTLECIWIIVGNKIQIFK